MGTFWKHWPKRLASPHSRPRAARTLGWLILVLLAAACGVPGAQDTPGSHGGPGNSPTGTGSQGNGTGGAPVGGGAGGEQQHDPLFPARIRRLTNAEYDASVQALFQTEATPSEEFGFPPDARQGPANSPAGPAFSVNAAQRVDPVLADKLDTAALSLAATARQNGTLARLAPCEQSTDEEECAVAFVRSFGGRAYRRQVTDQEVALLVEGPTSPYHVAADGYSYEDGIELLARIIVQMPAFLYLTELGDGDAPGPSTVLTPDEVAAELAYLFTARPPDEALLEAAAAGELATGEGRAIQAQRLLSTPGGRDRMVLLVREWLGITEVARRDKAQTVYPEFAELGHSMEEESRAFILELLDNSTGTLSELLTADWTIADDKLAALYGVSPAAPGKRTSLAGTGRRGILNQSAFLSVFATNDGSHPVFRGVAVMRRVTCFDTPDPGALGVVVSLPPADDSSTTRERFSRHNTDPACRNCHLTIDPLGFSLENFDGMGKARSTENGLAIDTAVEVDVGTDFDGSYSGSEELVLALAASSQVKACLARQLFRGTSGRSGPAARASEEAFLAEWETLPDERAERFEDILVAFARSPLFVERRVEQ